MAMTPEAKVKAAIKKFLLSLHNCWFYMPVSNGMGAHGVPDFIGCYSGWFFAIEAKAPGKERNTTPLQKMQISRIDGAGGLVIVATDVEQVREMFENHRQRLEAA